MQPRKYPPLLPATPLQREEESSSSFTQKSSFIDQQSAKHAGGKQVACNECRRRKTKCDGQRPTCVNCRRRGLSSCMYAEKMVPVPEVLVEVLKLFKTLPNDRASELLQAVRSNDDFSAALSSFKGDREGNSYQAGLDVDYDAPSVAQDSLESELMAKNPAAYPPMLPIVPSVLANSNLLRSVRDWVPMNQDPAAEMAEKNMASNTKITMNESRPMDDDSAIPQFRFANTPRQEIGYCDERFGDLDVSFWTDVKVTNDFAARAISLYIKTDHPLLGIFSPSLFIADLIGKQERFCSKFLFHALMYLGCQMYSAFDKSAILKAEVFCRKAEELWKTERTHDSYLTMAGAVLLSLCLIGHGKDHAVHSFAHEALEMGVRLGLFGTEYPQNMDIHAGVPQDELAARCYAAWGVFNWNVLISMFYRQPGSDCPVVIPVLPIPGDEASRSTPGQFSEDNLAKHEALLGSTFPALCHFWRITRGARWIYYPDGNSPPDDFKMAYAEYKFRELIAWAEALPRALIRTEDSPHHVAVFHIWLHCVILDIFRRFRRESVGRDYRMVTFSARDSSPNAAFSASVNQLKSLIVEYRTNYMASAYSILWHSGLIYLANAMVQDTSDPEWRLYFLLCIYGYESLGRPYRIAEVIAQGLLSMTLRDTNMTATDARKIMDELRERGLAHVKKNMQDEIRATFMVDLTLALQDPVEATVENMAKQFDSLAIFQDFLDQDRMEM